MSVNANPASAPGQVGHGSRPARPRLRGNGHERRSQQPRGRNRAVANRGTLLASIVMALAFILLSQLSVSEDHGAALGIPDAPPAQTAQP